MIGTSLEILSHFGHRSNSRRRNYPRTSQENLFCCKNVACKLTYFFYKYKNSSRKNQLAKPSGEQKNCTQITLNGQRNKHGKNDKIKNCNVDGNVTTCWWTTQIRLSNKLLLPSTLYFNKIPISVPSWLFSQGFWGHAKNLKHSQWSPISWTFSGSLGNWSKMGSNDTITFAYGWPLWRNNKLYILYVWLQNVIKPLSDRVSDFLLIGFQLSVLWTYY